MGEIGRSGTDLRATGSCELEILDREDGGGESGESYREVTVRVPESLCFFDGHFPGDPILPGVVQLERLALPEAEARWPELGPLDRIRRLKFIAPLRPGAVARLRLERKGPDSGRVEMSIWAGDICCTTAYLYFAEE